MNLDILHFLIPGYEPLQLFFFVLIVVGVASTLILLRKNATAASWEANWSGGGLGDLSGRLDAEHGSVNDLSHAVATRSEQLAETMPGILLILGLLGTFLGLGLALDSASNILTSHNTSAADGMKNSMDQLMHMMEGLGTKFKTSTWGIMGFLTLKLCSSYMGVDERRLRWCVRKMKEQLDGARDEVARRASLGTDRLVDAVGAMGVQLGSVLERELGANRKVLEQNGALLESSCSLGSQAKSSLSDIAGLMSAMLDKNNDMAASSAATSRELSAFVAANNENMQAMAQSSQQMADAAAGVGHSAGLLDVAIKAFGSDVKQVLDRVKQDLAGTISSMSDNFGTKLEQMEASLGGATTDISTAVQQLSGQMQQTLSSLETQLGTTLRDMNGSFSSNIHTMSSDLTAATAKISAAVEQSSESMGSAMQQMAGKLDEAVKIQSAAGRHFATISVALEEQVTAMTEVVKKLGDDIKSSLGAVSTSAQEVKRMNNRNENSSEAISSVAAELAAMVELMRTAQATEMSPQQAETAES